MLARRLPPPEPGFLAAPATLEASLLVPARNSAHALEATVTQAIRFFERQELGFRGSYEILLIPNPGARDREDRSLAIAEELAARHPRHIRVVPHREAPGKGAALRTGTAAARGRYILFTDADLPYDLEFFERALARLREGYGLVSGNRRLGTSTFDVPVSLLPLAYGRHRLGIAFNRVVRWLLPVGTSDTQAGIKALSRKLAREAFSRMECPGFFFDVELFLTARARGYRQLELPVTLFLNTEKSTVRVLRESVLAAYWLGRLWLRNRRGEYGT